MPVMQALPAISRNHRMAGAVRRSLRISQNRMRKVRSGRASAYRMDRRFPMTPDFEAGYAAGQRDMRNRARQVVTALAHSGGATFGEVARAIGALPITGERKI